MPDLSKSRQRLQRAHARRAYRAVHKAFLCVARDLDRPESRPVSVEDPIVTHLLDAVDLLRHRYPFLKGAK